MERKAKGTLKRAQLVEAICFERKIILEGDNCEIKVIKRVSHQYNDIIQRQISYCQEINDSITRGNTIT